MLDKIKEQHYVPIYNTYNRPKRQVFLSDNFGAGQSRNNGQCKKNLFHNSNANFSGKWVKTGVVKGNT